MHLRQYLLNRIVSKFNNNTNTKIKNNYDDNNNYNNNDKKNNNKMIKSIQIKQHVRKEYNNRF